MPRICVFDVNETLLDLRALDPHFERLFGTAHSRREWFNQVIQSAMVATITNAYADFSTIGGAALEMLARRYGVAMSNENRQQVLSAMRTLPPHADVHEGLELLRDAGLHLIALTNSPTPMAIAQLTNAGLNNYFMHILSVDTVRRFKPAPEVYHMAAQHLGVAINQVRLIAAHSWDIAGAVRAGCAAAFVARRGMVLDPLVPPPDIIGTDLREVAEQIIRLEMGQTASSSS